MRVASAESTGGVRHGTGQDDQRQGPAQERDAGGDTDGQDSGNEAVVADPSPSPRTCHQQRGHRAR